LRTRLVGARTHQAKCGCLGWQNCDRRLESWTRWQRSTITNIVIEHRWRTNVQSRLFVPPMLQIGNSQHIPAGPSAAIADDACMLPQCDAHFHRDAVLPHRRSSCKCAGNGAVKVAVGPNHAELRLWAGNQPRNQPETPIAAAVRFWAWVSIGCTEPDGDKTAAGTAGYLFPR
jgi:hypothetical protein